MSLTSEQIYKQEMESLLEDIKTAYEQSGKKVSGQFEEGLKIEYKDNGAALWGYGYLAGRGPTKNGNNGEPTLRERIYDWLKARGIRPHEPNMKLTSLAYVIARKIHKDGTNKKYHLKIYEKVVTPERVQSIIDKVSSFYVQDFVHKVEVEMIKLTTNI